MQTGSTSKAICSPSSSIGGHNTLRERSDKRSFEYLIDLKFSKRQVWTSSVDPDQRSDCEQSDQGLHCLLLCLHLYDALFYSKIKSFNFSDNYSYVLGCPNFSEI